MTITTKAELAIESAQLLVFSETLMMFAVACVKNDAESAVAYNSDLMRLYSEAAQR